MEDELNRREFMHAGTLSLAALQTGGVSVGSTQDVESDTKGFQAVAHLVGKGEHRPAPNSDFFEREDFQRTYYGYLYDPTDEYARYFITQDDDEWQTIEMIPTTALDEVATQQAISFFNHTFARPEAPDTKNWSFADADVTKVDTEVELSATTVLQTTQRGNYPPGNEATAGVAWRVTGTPTVGEGLAGYFDDANGLLVGEDATDSFVAIRKGGVEKRVYRPDWNGYVPKNRVWDNNRPVITRFPHLFYGGGDLSITALIPGREESELEELHRFTPQNVDDTFGQGSPIDQPNLPIRFESDSLTGGNVRGNAAHYQFSLAESEDRVNGEHFGPVSVASSGWTELITWRKRAGWDMVNVKPLKISVSAASNPVRLQLLLDPTISSATATLPGNTSSSETSVEIVDGTVSADGERRWVGYSAGGQGSSTDSTTSNNLTFNLPVDQPVSLFGQSVGGSATVNGAVAWEEFF